MNETRAKILILAGPTASGKTSLSLDLARDLGCEIVSADSMQLYQWMDIGSAKPTPEERARAVHYLVDEIDPAAPFSVAEYREHAGRAIQQILDKGKIPLIVGGTGLYVHSLLYNMDFSETSQNTARRQELQKLAEQQGGEALHRILRRVDPVAAERIHPNNIKKMIRAVEAAESGHPVAEFQRTQEQPGPYDCLLFGVTRRRDVLYERINQRVDEMIRQGLVEEVRSLSQRGLTPDMISMKGIGYKEVFALLQGECTLDETVEQIKRSTRRYSKRQMTWFRRYDQMIWYDITEESHHALQDMKQRAGRFLSGVEITQKEDSNGTA